MKTSVLNTIYLSIFLSLAGCGQKSVITVDTESRTMAEAYGDGQYVIRPIVLPLSDQVVASFDSPVSKVDFIAGGFARMFMDIGVAMGAGRTQMSMIQPLPDLSGMDEYIKGARISRVFFYIEPTKSERETGFFSKIFKGQHNTNFKFLDKLAIKASPVEQNSFTTWFPEFVVSTLKKKDYVPLQALFDSDKKYVPAVGDNSKVLLKFDGEKKEQYLLNKTRGATFIIQSDEAAFTRRSLSRDEVLKPLIKNIQVLNKTIILELQKTPLAAEVFQARLGDNSHLIEDYKISFIEECSIDTCMDVKVEDQDLMGTLMKGNAMKVDVYMSAKKAPQSFQLKGFIEFEVKLKLNF